MPLQPIENGEYLHEKIAKYSTIGDYEIGNGDICAVYLDSVAPGNFIAKFQFIDLCKTVKQLAFNKHIYYTLKAIREATSDDDNMFPTYANDRMEKKFSIVVILGACTEEAVEYLKNDSSAMDEHHVVPGAGVMRKLT